ncbi:RNA polymerase I-specific transcription initiation factor RRN6 [Nakaseomyces bracarensis]|uniref:RNA polymerase I-specific transcription initiation factor RRN6 n=1 Tax=Nakaseomyces bracarensis TaxID=273131 RepID=A0ABR4NT96_9SACH
MDTRKVPGSRPIGAQLGIGIQSPHLYVPKDRTYTEDYDSDGDEVRKRNRWLSSVDDAIPKDILDVKVVWNEPVNLSEGSKIMSREIVDDEDLVDDDLISDTDESDESDDDAELRKHLGWDKLEATVPKKLEVYPKLNVKEGVDPAYAANIRENSVVAEYVPTQIMDKLINETRTKDDFDEEDDTLFTTVDPNCDSLLTIGKVLTKADIRNNLDERTLVAYRQPTLRSSLIIASMEKCDIKVKDQKGHDEKLEIYKPTHRKYRSLRFNLKSNIKSIKFAKLSEAIGSFSDMIGILTDNAFHVIKLNNFDSRMREITYTHFEPLTFHEIGDFAIADFDFNPWDSNEVAIIDIKGNWSVVKIPKVMKNSTNMNTLKLTVKRYHNGSIFDIEELSNWKRIRWSNHFTRLLVMNEARLIELDFKQNWQQEIIQAKTWSKIRDVADLNDRFKLILTSRELIVTATNSLSAEKNGTSIRREVSWLHNISQDDATLRCRVQKYHFNKKSIFFVYIFSKRHTVIYLHGFSINDEDSIQSFGVSKLLKVPNISKISSIDIETVESSDYYHDNSDLNNITTTALVFDEEKNNVYNLCLSNAANYMSRDTSFSIAESELKSLVRLPSKGMQNLMKKVNQKYHEIFLKYNNTGNSEEEKLQEFGYELSNKLNEVIERLDSENVAGGVAIESIIAGLPVSEEFDELESFLEQFFEHYGELGIKFSDIGVMMGQILHETIPSIDIFFNKLLQCWSVVELSELQSGIEALTKEVVNILIWKYLRYYKNNDIDELVKTNYEKLNTEYQSIVDQWAVTDDELMDGLGDSHADLQSISSLPKQFSQYQESQSQKPLIRSSERKAGASRMRSSQLTQRSSQSTTLPTSMSPAFSLMNSQPPSLASLSQSQKGKRKKRRVGGFG